jgi:hypothetical protein
LFSGTITRCDFGSSDGTVKHLPRGKVFEKRLTPTLRHCSPLASFHSEQGNPIFCLDVRLWPIRNVYRRRYGGFDGDRSPLPGKLRLSAVIILSPSERISGHG